MQLIIAGALVSLLAPVEGLNDSIATVASTPVTAEEPGPIIGRQFDLRSLTYSAPGKVTMGRNVRLLPITRPLLQSGPKNDNAFDVVWTDESLGSRIVDAFINMTEDDLERVEVVEEAIVYLEGTVDQLQAFEDYTSKLAAAIANQPTMEIRRFSVDATQGASLPKGVRLGGPVSRAALDAWMQDAEIPYEQRSMRLPGGGVHSIADLESHTVMLALYAQIAQGSAIFDPETADIVVGSELTMSGYRSGSGVRLCYSASLTRREDNEPGSGAVGEVRLYTKDGGVYEDRSARWVEGFGATGGSVTGEGLVDGERFLVLSVGTAGGQRMCLAIGVAPNSIEKPATGLLGDFGEASSFVLPTGLLYSQQFNVTGENQFAQSTLECESSTLWANDKPRLLRVSEGAGSLLGVICDSLDIQDRHDFKGTTLLILPKDDATRLARAVKGTTPANMFSVSIESKDALGRVAARGGLSVLDGSTGVLVAGHERLIAKDSEVEVAQFAATSQPRTMTHFAGLLLSLQLGTAPDGSLVYRAMGQSSTDLDISKGSANEATDGGLLAVSAAHLVILESGVAQPGARTGLWTVLLGDETKTGAYVELTIESH